MIALAKLRGAITGSPITHAVQHVLNGLLALVIPGATAFLLAGGSSFVVLTLLVVLTLILGVASVLPIGGAQMPVGISLLNTCTGLAVASSGFVLDNLALIVAGTPV